MAGRILTSANDLASVRRAIDVSLTAALLPDAVIQDQVYLGMAEAEVLRRDPDALSRTGDERAAVRRAAVFLTAALLLPAVPRIVSEQHGDLHRYQRTPTALAETIADLRAKADGTIDRLLADDDEADEPMLHFALGAGRRGR